MPNHTHALKLLGREPAAWISAAGSVLVVLAALGFPWLNAGQAAALTALIAAVILVATTRPVAPGLVTGVVAAGAALLVEYGMEVPDAAVGAVSGAVLAVFALISRQQLAPQDTAITHR